MFLILQPISTFNLALFKLPFQLFHFFILVLFYNLAGFLYFLRMVMRYDPVDLLILVPTVETRQWTINHIPDIIFIFFLDTHFLTIYIQLPIFYLFFLLFSVHSNSFDLLVVARQMVDHVIHQFVKLRMVDATELIIVCFQKQQIVFLLFLFDLWKIEIALKRIINSLHIVLDVLFIHQMNSYFIIHQNIYKLLCFLITVPVKRLELLNNRPLFHTFLQTQVLQVYIVANFISFVKLLQSWKVYLFIAHYFLRIVHTLYQIYVAIGKVPEHS